MTSTIRSTNIVAQFLPNAVFLLLMVAVWAGCTAHGLAELGATAEGEERGPSPSFYGAQGNLYLYPGDTISVWFSEDTPTNKPVVAKIDDDGAFRFGQFTFWVAGLTMEQAASRIQSQLVQASVGGPVWRVTVMRGRPMEKEALEQQVKPQSDQPKPGSDKWRPLPPPFPLFPTCPPITNADPSIRLPLLVHVPTKLKAERVVDNLWVGLDPDCLEATNLTLGRNMLSGAQSWLYVYPEGESRPTNFVQCTQGPDVPAQWYGAPFKLSPRVKRYVVELEFIVFRNHGLWPWVSGYAPAQLLTNCLSPYGGLPKAPCFARGCLLVLKQTFLQCTTAVSYGKRMRARTIEFFGSEP